MAFAALLLRLKVRRRWIPALFAVVYIPCVISATYAQPSSLRLPELPIILGVRDTVPIIDNDFCKGAFQTALEKELKREGLSGNLVKPWPILNQQRGRSLPRYDGLIKEQVHIECGPNSERSRHLFYETGTQKTQYEELVSFSNIFYSTNVKLLLTRTLADELRALPESELRNRYKTLKIGFIPRTTTALQFEKATDSQDNKFYSKSTAIEVEENGDARKKALEELINGRIEALASDGIILRSFLESLNPKEYEIFPSDKLPYLSPEEYVLVFNKTSNKYLTRDLENVINRALAQIVQKQKEKLKAYEDGSTNPPPPKPIDTINPTPTISPDHIAQTSNKENLYFQILTFTLLLFGLLYLVFKLVIPYIFRRINQLRREMLRNQQVAQKASPRHYPSTAPTVSSLHKRKERLQIALIDAFPDLISIEKMLAYGLEKNLHEIAGEGNLDNVVFKLIQKAEAQGWLNGLVEAAYNANHGNPLLREIYDEFFPAQSHNH
jgi:Effector-associated domain 1